MSVNDLTRRYALRVLAAGASAVALAGCATLETISRQTEEIDLFELSPKTVFDPDLPTVGWQLVVEEPTAASAVNTDRITLKPSPLEVRYASRARWTDRAPRLVQTMLVESFENTNRIPAVGRQAIGLNPDFTLKSELREFQAETYQDPRVPVIHVQLNMKIIREPEGVIIASRTFEQKLPAQGDRLDNIVLAFDDALGKLLKRSVSWTLVTIDAMAPGGPRLPTPKPAKG